MHAKVFKFLTHKGHQLFINGTLFAVASVFTIEKTTTFSLVPHLKRVVTENGYIVVQGVAIGVIVYASLAKLATMIVEAFPPPSGLTQEPERISECLLVINNEIKRHLDEIAKSPVVALQSFPKSHSFEVNVAHAVGGLAAHLKRAFSHLKIRDRDIFISLYQAVNVLRPGANPQLVYVTHWDLNRDAVFSKTIEVDPKGKFKGYECVKAIVQGVSSVVLWDCSSYKKSRNNRGKIKHYVGLKMEHAGELLGFLNIELHDKQLFADEIAMREFVEKEIIGFKYLIEYQFLKRKFFSVVNEHLIKKEAA